MIEKSPMYGGSPVDAASDLILTNEEKELILSRRRKAVVENLRDDAAEELIRTAANYLRWSLDSDEGLGSMSSFVGDFGYEKLPGFLAEDPATSEIELNTIMKSAIEIIHLAYQLTRNFSEDFK